MSTDEQNADPREVFLEKLNAYLGSFLAPKQGGGAKVTMIGLAEYLGCNRVTLYRWLDGSSAMPRNALERLCKRVGLTDEQQNELLWLGGYIDEPASSRPSQPADLPRPEEVRVPIVQVMFPEPLPIREDKNLPPPAPGNAPPRPRLMLGRDEDLEAIKARLGLRENPSGAIQVLTAMRGWPGVGKTTLASALAHDPEIAQAFPDGVLWASLGQQPNLARELGIWGRLLGVPDLLQASTAEEMSARLRSALRTKRCLLIVDDAWRAEHIRPFDVGGERCALLITTRRTEVAEAIASTPGDIYKLGVLSEADALELLRRLAPTVVAESEKASRELLKDIEHLPLAIQVAGRLLQAEASRGFGVTQLLAEIRAGARLIEAKAPADRTEVAQDTTPTVAALLKKSTDLLDGQTLDCFAYLGAFAPKPATFDAEAMKAIWQIDDPKPAIRSLIDHGLLEPVEGARFWLHAILVAHANSFLTEEDGFTVS